MTAYRFAILRYVPDPVRQEAINVGVVVASAEPSRIAVRVLQRREAARLKWLGFDDDIEFLQDLAEEMRASPPFGSERTWNPETLERAHREWGGTVRVSEVRAALHDNADRLCEELYARYVANPRTRQPSTYRDRRAARARVSRALRDRLLGETVQAAPTVQGHFEEHRFDFGLGNGQPLHLVATFSFEVPDKDRFSLQTEVDACAWAISDVRAAEVRVPITVVTIGETQRRLLDRAEDMYESLGARLVREPQIDDWARGVSSEIEDYLRHAPTPPRSRRRPERPSLW
ncbi:MAG TPA: DUF3037 domain-containing protein [Actinomycetes bacterium]|jgi:hypothetical protein|nr:DUF3037 domain-containing protein [Actinomycetes bacterium]